MSPDQKPNGIEAAIAAVEEPQSVTMITIPVTISSTGRPFEISVPVDMTDAELIEAGGWMLTALSNHFRAERVKTAGGRIIIPGPGGRLA